mmetsp:Transcript_4946/g.10411  ORF Transcript_4946/g.10411 Transcript_4946/m.10411 type:complete len:633 (-) Transcript_4946:318-2216(-)|eukprot:CAMPEP_0201123044 /NCGR_PEP_ID=MMETSP0850-20130426/6520_1 /ASSEMBLY_ACC=CAM_ASM_000622 /TAXON_ID=183588 /ORGANISM="Pseudo-nitzschia fraudulenta, Strain WWA7" /LENGTH=632 /DNA_ID=CAMNT_0047389853 /DNA_START=285 /DNA_END=2183 /DNA_ORIENTATION=-
MGTYLSTPVTEKCEESGDAPGSGNDLPVEWGVVDMQGWRKSMEDAHTAVTSVPMAGDRQGRVFGVYDGHGGPEVARFCQHYFVSVLTNQESWVSNNRGEKGLPLSGDDDRVPAPPPGPVDGPYDGNGNEQGYRSSHLPAAVETPVGKALRETFHAIDRMVDDLGRRPEIVSLRTSKPAKGETKTLADGANSIPPVPCPSEAVEPPEFYTAAGGETIGKYLASAEDETNETGTEAEQQADRSLSMALDPEQAEALKKSIEEFSEAIDNQDAADGKGNRDTDSQDSDAPVGQEEAVALDSNIDDDIDSSNASGEGDATAAAATEDAKATGTNNGGKVTTMLQKILSLGGTGAAASNEGATEPQTEAAPVQEEPVMVQAPRYPDSSEITGASPRHPSITHNGRLVCNLPDHPIHAGATAVVAVITGNILTVANAGDSRAVLCRRRKTTAGTTDESPNGYYAYPLSYDHKPSQVHEMNRILRSGGFVNHFGRINGNLNLSRSIGDLKYKQVPGIPPAHQMITAEPDIMQIALDDSDEFIVLGCDGIWDCLSNEQAVNFVKSRIDTKSPTEIGIEMLDTIISDDPRVTQGIGGDNMTVMIIDLQTSKRSRKIASEDESSSPQAPEENPTTEAAPEAE